MSFLLVVVALAIVAGVALLVSGEGGRLAPSTPDREPVDLPGDRLVEAHDLDRTRFALGVRGYRMDQVDAVLDRLASDLRVREAYVQELLTLAQKAELEVPPLPTPAPTPSPAAVQADAIDGADDDVNSTPTVGADD